MNEEIPFSYDYVLEKISAYYDTLDREKIVNDLMETIINDFTNSNAKLVAEIVIKNMFGLPFKVAKVANKLVPFAYDMYYAPETIYFPVNNGLLNIFLKLKYPLFYKR